MQKYVIGGGEFVKVAYFTSNCEFIGAFEFDKMDEPLAFFESAFKGVPAGYELDEKAARIFAWLAWILEENTPEIFVNGDNARVINHNLPGGIIVKH